MHEFVQHHHNMAVLLFVAALLLGNVPVGRMRNRYPRFSRPWSRCLYIPLTAGMVMRHFMEIPYTIIPMSIAAVLVGQFIGSRIEWRGTGAGNSGIPMVKG